MAARMRGGKATTLTHDQLQSLGVGKDMAQVQTAPPPLYPSLNSIPVSLDLTKSQSYQVLWWSDFLDHMRDSPYHLRSKYGLLPNQMQRYSDQYMSVLTKSKKKTKAEYNWHMMPSELQIITKKRGPPKSKERPAKASKTSKTTNIDAHLKLLEEKEREETRGLKTNTDSEHEEEEEEKVIDEEMDDENDYGNSYFDNGESYNDNEDDNLDDGPVY